MSGIVRSRSLTVVLPLLLVVAGLFAVYLNEQRLLDWVKLRNYTPPAAVSALARDTTMSSYGEHLFYVNKPLISNGSDFSSECPAGAEKTVVLGCYKSGDRGIYLYKVSDARLNGIVQVTAAHEMLHAAYARLSANERQRTDALLTAFYEHSLKDERIRKTIDLYKKTEPDQLTNEMHSIFGTELVTLSPELEQYYTRYFANRAAVVAYMNRYQAEFTSRQEKVEQYDVQLTQLKQRIEQNQKELGAQRDTLAEQLATMNELQTSGNISAYNSLVASYNVGVRSYNTLLAQIRTDIETYNEIVDARNTIALEEQQLTQALSSQNLPTAP